MLSNSDIGIGSGESSPGYSPSQIAGDLHAGRSAVVRLTLSSKGNCLKFATYGLTS